MAAGAATLDPIGMLTGIGAHFDDLPILHHKHAEMSELDKDNNCTYHTHIWLHKVL